MPKFSTTSFTVFVLFVTLTIRTNGTAQTVAAQIVANEPVFKVLAAQGEVAVSKSSEVIKLVAGKSVYGDQIIQLTGKSYLGLMHKSGKSVELRTPGTYKVWDLNNELVKTSGSSLTKKYAKYVFGELQRDDEKGMRKNHQQYMAVTGAVSRAAIKNGVVKAYVPAGSQIAEGLDTRITWAPVANAGGYTLTLYDMFDTVVWSAETTDTSIALDFNQIKALNTTRTGILKIGTKARGLKNAVGYPIKLMQATESLKLKQELEGYALEHKESASSALDAVVRAYFFESASLNLNAMQCFQQAILLAPEIDDYKAQYQDFLVRTGLVQVGE